MKLYNSLTAVALVGATAFFAIPLSAQAQAPIIRQGERCFDVLGRRVPCPPGLPPERPPLPPGEPSRAGGSFGAPEPGTFLIVGSGLVGLAAWYRKRAKALSRQSSGL